MIITVNDLKKELAMLDGGMPIVIQIAPNRYVELDDLHEELLRINGESDDYELMKAAPHQDHEIYTVLRHRGST